VTYLSQAYAAQGEKKLALKEAERAMLDPANDRGGPGPKKTALVQTIASGMTERSQLARVTHSLLGLEPQPNTHYVGPFKARSYLGSLRGDPAFQNSAKKSSRSLK
jgi:hypothetical protein